MCVCQLHWLLVRQRINFKIATITYRVRQSGQPAYLCSELEDYWPTRNSRSSAAPLLHRPHVNMSFLPGHFQFLHQLFGISFSLKHACLTLTLLSEIG